MSEDIQFQIECLSTELVEMLMQKYGWDMKKGLDELYSSETYKRLCNPACGLYYEGAVYVFSYLENEIETGVVKQLIQRYMVKNIKDKDSFSNPVWKVGDEITFLCGNTQKKGVVLIVDVHGTFLHPFSAATLRLIPAIQVRWQSILGQLPKYLNILGDVS